MSIIQELYDLEINVTISWFWDAGFDLTLGDEINGIRAQTTVETWAKAEWWLRETAAEYWPGCREILILKANVLEQCSRCNGTGAIDTPFSGSDPSCPDCDGEGVIY